MVELSIYAYTKVTRHWFLFLVNITVSACFLHRYNSLDWNWSDVAFEHVHNQFLYV